MVVTVKEAKKRMEELQEEYNEFLKLHNYALCLDLNKNGESTYADSPEKDARRKVLETIKKESKTNYDIRSLCSIACKLCEGEMKRIKKIIDNQKVDI